VGWEQHAVPDTDVIGSQDFIAHKAAATDCERRIESADTTQLRRVTDLAEPVNEM